MSGPTDPAFPITPEIWATHPDFFGLTKREYFAGQALPTVLNMANIHMALVGQTDEIMAAWAAKVAYGLADAMVAESERSK